MTSRWAGLAVCLLLAVGWMSLNTTGCDPCASCSGGGGGKPTASPTPGQTPTGQGLIGIDPINNVGYVPIYTLSGGAGVRNGLNSSDANAASVPGSAQLAVVDLTVGATSPILGLIELSNSIQPLGVVFSSKTGRIYAEGRLADDTVNVYEIDTSTHTVTNTIPCPGLSDQGIWGGLVADPVQNILVVGGSHDIALIDTSTEPPTFNAASVTSLGQTVDSLTTNPNTHLLFVSGDGSNVLFNTTTVPLVPITYQDLGATTDGIGYDSSTNIILISPEFNDEAFGLNFNSLVTTGSPATSPTVLVPGLGVLPPFGEGPGGQAVVNPVKHQGVVADEFGQNFKLVQMPSTAVTGALNNNGQPGSSTSPDASSVYEIAAALIPTVTISTVQTQLVSVGDPNSLTADPKHNFVYMLADTVIGFHCWANRGQCGFSEPGTVPPLYLIRSDLSAPVLGGSPTGGPSGTAFWNPTQQTIQMP